MTVQSYFPGFEDLISVNQKLTPLNIRSRREGQTGEITKVVIQTQKDFKASFWGPILPLDLIYFYK